MRYKCLTEIGKRGLLTADDKKRYIEIVKNVFRCIASGDYSNLSEACGRIDISGVEVNVIFTDNGGIREYNREYRNIDRETDVLSFPMSEFRNGLVYVDIDNINPENNYVMLGDVIISVDRMRSQAEEFGHSDTRELAFLMAHAMLHLLGYDHMTENEEKLMNSLAQKALDSMGYTRDI